MRVGLFIYSLILQIFISNLLCARGCATGNIAESDNLGCPESHPPHNYTNEHRSAVVQSHEGRTKGQHIVSLKLGESGKTAFRN